MQSILVLALVFSCTLTLNVTLNQQWKLWKEANKKHYSDAEEHVRYDIIISIYRFCLLILEKFIF